MKKLSIILAATAAILLASSLTWQAQAQTTRGAASIPAQAQNFTPVQQAGCRRAGRYCAAGFTRRCGVLGCWCAACF